MKRITKIGLMVVALLGGVLLVRSVSAGIEPTVTKTYRTYSSYKYTVTADSGKITGYPDQGDPTASGGCKVNFIKTRRGHITDGATCTSLGTVTFTSPNFPVCETPFMIKQDNLTIYTDLLNAPCPPPQPPSVVVVNEVTSISFYNPADVIQSKTLTITIPSLDTAYTSADPFNYQTMTMFAGIGLNKYVYFQATINVSLNPGQTIVLTRL